MRKSIVHRAALCAFGLGLLASAASAASRDAVLGSAGELYRIQAGPLGTLFPDREGVDPKRSVLALEIVRPGVPVERILVEGTEDESVEITPSLAYEDSSKTLFVVWESRLETQSALRLAGFDGRVWSEPVGRITDDFFSRKTPPQMAVTHDMFETVDLAGEKAEIHRRILHLVWGEGEGTAQRVLYTPVIFDNGVYIGQNPVYDLTALDNGSGLATTFEASSELLRAPTLQKGRDGRSVVVAFVAPETRRLLSLEIDVLPRELSSLADDTRAVIIDTGAKFRGNIRGLADKARQAIIEHGRDAFHMELLEAIGDRVREQILAGGTKPIQAVADDTRAVIIDTGAKLAGRGLRNPRNVFSAVERLEEITPNVPLPVHVIRFQVVSSRPVPRISGSQVTLFLSETGEDVLIAWVGADPGKVSYRDSKNGGWNNPLDLLLSDKLTLEQAYKILERRIGER